MLSGAGNETGTSWIVPDETTDGVWELDLATNEYRLSPRWYAALGYRPDEVPPGSAGWTALIHPDDLPRALAEMCTCIASRPDVFVTTMRLRAVGGDYRLVLSRGKVVTRTAGGIPRRMVGHLIDLTAALAALPAAVGEPEAARRRAEVEQRSRTLDEAPVGIYETDAQGNCSYVNRCWAELAGVPREAGLGQGWRALVHPEDRARVDETLRAHQRDEGPWTWEHRVRTPAGKTRWIASTALALRSERGAITGYIGTCVDISAAVAARDELRAAKLLEERLRQTQKLEAIGRLAGGIAHDSNNLLTAMLARLTLVRRGGRLAPEDAAELVELERDIERAVAMTRQLLQFSRRQPLQLAPLELNQLLERVGGLLRRLLGETIDISLAGTGTPLWLDGDTGMIEQVIVNLCVNARDAMPEGGRLTLRTSVAAVSPDDARRHDEARPGRYACLEVADNGRGMDPATLARALEPFFTTKESGRGVGLGLPTTHGIARQHGGWLELESAPGRGTTVRVFLPLRAEAAAGATVADKPALAPGTETILLVEDEAFLRRAVVRLLRDLGYRVLDAGDAPTALALWAQHRQSIAVLVTDLTMPGGDGLALATRLRREQPALEVILTSGYAEEPEPPEGLVGRRFAFIAKPWTPEALVRTVRDCLGLGAAAARG
jgi:two-component system, cell cycle sensor histidine kinase and response regulator CckA